MFGKREDIKIKEGVIGLADERKTLKKVFSEMPSIKKLWQDLMTTSAPIPKREKTGKTPYWGRRPKERFETFRRITGEKDIARRVDYR